jgi:hypothetical protein
VKGKIGLGRPRKEQRRAQSKRHVKMRLRLKCTAAIKEIVSTSEETPEAVKRIFGNEDGSLLQQPGCRFQYKRI